jgi:hypothetical protein
LQCSQMRLTLARTFMAAAFGSLGRNRLRKKDGSGLGNAGRGRNLRHQDPTPFPAKSRVEAPQYTGRPQKTASAALAEFLQSGAESRVTSQATANPLSRRVHAAFRPRSDFRPCTIASGAQLLWGSRQTPIGGNGPLDIRSIGGGF